MPTNELTRLSKLLLAAVTTSYGWLLLACVVPLVAGPNYSHERVFICNVNISICAGTGIALTATQKPRLLFAVVGAWIALGWVYFRAISFAV